MRLGRGAAVLTGFEDVVSGDGGGNGEVGVGSKGGEEKSRSSGRGGDEEREIEKGADKKSSKGGKNKKSLSSSISDVVGEGIGEDEATGE